MLKFTVQQCHVNTLRHKDDIFLIQVSQIKDLYKLPDPNDGVANRDAVDDVMGDRSFICPSISFAEQLSSTGIKNYQYRLTHRASNEVWPEWMGVIHGADIQVLKLFYHGHSCINRRYQRITNYANMNSIVVADGDTTELLIRVFRR